MQIAIGGIMHESDTRPLPTDLAASGARRGAEILERWRDTPPRDGRVTSRGAARWGFDVVPDADGLGARPAGPVTREAFETLTGELSAAGRACGRLDAMLLACHGADGAPEEHPDADGEIIRRVREALGPRAPRCL